MDTVAFVRVGAQASTPQSQISNFSVIFLDFFSDFSSIIQSKIIVVEGANVWLFKFFPVCRG